MRSSSDASSPSGVSAKSSLRLCGRGFLSSSSSLAANCRCKRFASAATSASLLSGVDVWGERLGVFGPALADAPLEGPGIGVTGGCCGRLRRLVT